MFSLGRTEMFFSKKVMNRSDCIRSFSCPGFWTLESWALWSTRYSYLIKAEENIFSVWALTAKLSFVNGSSQRKNSIFNFSYNAPAGKVHISYSWIWPLEKSPHEFGTGWRYGKTLPLQFRSTAVLPITKNKAIERREETKAKEIQG